MKQYSQLKIDKVHAVIGTVSAFMPMLLAGAIVFFMDFNATFFTDISDADLRIVRVHELYVVLGAAVIAAVPLCWGWRKR